MREILFRAKHVHTTKENEHLNGRWIYGYLSDGKYINSPELGGEFLIDPDTICQYTGLTDKNGKKIWENDVVKHKDSQCFGAIRWYRGDYVGWCVDDVHDYEQQFSIDMFNECEVIGNIFDNPDLLEE